jgi:hypothetical protein
MLTRLAARGTRPSSISPGSSQHPVRPLMVNKGYRFLMRSSHVLLPQASNEPPPRPRKADRSGLEEVELVTPQASGVSLDDDNDTTASSTMCVTAETPWSQVLAELGTAVDKPVAFNREPKTNATNPFVAAWPHTLANLAVFSFSTRSVSSCSIARQFRGNAVLEF